MADLAGPNNFALLATTLGGLGFEGSETDPVTRTELIINDSVGLYERISRIRSETGDDPADYFTFNPSGLSEVSISVSVSVPEDYANYLIVVPRTGVTSVEGDILGTWYGGDYRNASGRFGDAVESAANGTFDRADTLLQLDANISNTTLSRDEDMTANWMLDGGLVTIEVFGFQLDGPQPPTSAFSFDVSEVTYSITVTPVDRAFSDIGDGGLLFNNDLIFSETHTGRDTIDTYVFGGSRSEFSVSVENDARLLVSPVGINSTDTLINIERVQLNDGYLAFDTTGNAGQIYRLYQAAFDRDPDVAGLGHWIDTFDKKLFDLNGIAEEFLISEEFKLRFGTEETLDDEGYLTLLYNNVLDRDPDAPGFEFWQEQQSNGLSRSEMLTHFSESAENFANTASEIDAGIFYI